jgi:hypothetical protein
MNLRRTTKWLRLAALAVGCSVLCRAQGDGEEASLEYRVKAAYLLNFAKFVDWPENKFPDPSAPLNICLFGEDPFGRMFDQMVEGETVNAHKIVMQRLSGGAALNSCHILFIPRGEKNVAKTLAAARPGILTVGDGDSFLRDGGMIVLIIDNRRVRFDINQRAAAEAMLRVSSRLLTLARTVEK